MKGKEGVSRYDGQTFTTFTTEDGLPGGGVLFPFQDRQGHLWFPWWSERGGVSRYDGQTFTTFTTEDGLASDVVFRGFQDRKGDLWFFTLSDSVSRYDGQIFTTFATERGLFRGNFTFQDQEGYFWFGTEGHGLKRFDGETFTPFDIQDGLASNVVLSGFRDREGYLWFGTDSGVSRYDEQTFTTFTEEDGLGNDDVRSIVHDRKGHLWFGTDSGIIRYDGQTFTTFTTKDGLPYNSVYSVALDREDNIWFSTWGNGVTRYDGKAFATYKMQDGLAWNWVTSIIQGHEGYLWFGSAHSTVSQYDGKVFQTLVLQGDPAKYSSSSIYQDREGHLWSGSIGGVIRYDGQTFTTFTEEDGLGNDDVRSIFQDREGHLWFGTSGGASRYDGQVLQTLTSRDGLAGNSVSSILQDREGNMWFSTNGGVTCFRPPTPSPPTVFIDAVVADRRYEGCNEVEIPSSVDAISFELRAINFKTRPEAMVYRYRLKGSDEDWKTTHNRHVEYQDLPRGTYTFEVQAVDRDLVYSESPAKMPVRIYFHIPYEQIGWISTLAVAIMVIVLQTVRVVQRGRRLKEEQRQRLQAQQQLMQEMERELQTAHDMQMGLMPTESPDIRGIDMAGRCLPANHVGGDFFQYFHVSPERMILSLADVTGHAMEAAIPVVMFSGILETQMESGDSLEELFAKLNHSLSRILNRRTFVCFTMGDFNPETRKIRLSNGGCPYPYHYQASSQEIAEIQIDAYPLGIHSETTYPVVEVQLGPGDRIVFCSDGIIEAANDEEVIFGFERTAETIRNGCKQNRSAPQLLDYLMNEVKRFAGDAPQGDDMTVVVLKVES